MPYFRPKWLLLLVLWPRLLWAQMPAEPLQLAEQFVAPEGWPQMRSYLCCEAARQAKRQSLGQQIPRRLLRHCQLLTQDSAVAVVAVELRDSAARNDFYLHFVRQATGWKLRAVRSLAMTALGAPMLGMLAAMPPAEIARYNQAHPAAGYDFTVGNLRLWMGADADIIRHFNRRRQDFEAVVRLVRNKQYFVAPDSTAAGEQAANADPAVQALLQSLFISRLTRRATGCATCLEFSIGGRMASTVGLLYQPDAAAVPAMSPDRIIVLRPLGGGWYLYKTT